MKLTENFNQWQWMRISAFWHVPQKKGILRIQSLIIKEVLGDAELRACLVMTTGITMIMSCRMIRYMLVSLAVSLRCQARTYDSHFMTIL
jgi:hypothetical protein